MSRALKRTVRPRLETEQGKGSACNSDWITAAGKPSLSHRINFRTITYFLQDDRKIKRLIHSFIFIISFSFIHEFFDCFITYSQKKNIKKESIIMKIINVSIIFMKFMKAYIDFKPVQPV